MKTQISSAVIHEPDVASNHSDAKVCRTYMQRNVHEAATELIIGECIRPWAIENGIPETMKPFQINSFFCAILIKVNFQVKLSLPFP